MRKVEVDFQFCKAVPISWYDATQVAIERTKQDLFESDLIPEEPQDDLLDLLNLTSL